MFDLTPLTDVSMNRICGLRRPKRAQLSPLFWPAPAGRALDVLVGAAESSEFLRQSGIFAETWQKGGVETRYEEVAGANHFTVIDTLPDPASAMVSRLKALVGRTQG